MAMLAFLPWVTVSKPHTISRFALVPWRKGTSPDVDGVLEPYIDRVDHHVESATLVHFAGEPLTRDLSEDERADLFDLAMALAFSALARRELCGRWGAVPYANSDSFRLVIQGFREGDPGSVAEVIRRRGGRVLAGYSHGTYQVRRPTHVDVLPRYELDATLVSSVLAALNSQGRVVYEESIFSFNNANTDSEQVPVQHEIVALVGALERLTEKSGKADPVARAVVDLLAPHLSPDRPRHLSRLNRFEALHGATGKDGQRIRSASVTEAWVRDLYRMRNAFGHGRRVHDRESPWTPEGHLVLGAHLFPLAVLVRLAKDGHYTLTDKDKSRIFAFPRLASLRQPLRWSIRRGSVWNDALKSANDELLFGRALAAMEAATRGDPEPTGRNG
jgi:hypothetical protein